MQDGLVGSVGRPLSDLLHDPGLPPADLPQTPHSEHPDLPLSRQPPAGLSAGRTASPHDKGYHTGGGSCPWGFFYHYFLLPKEHGGLHSILDVKDLSCYLWPLRCKMLKVPSVCQAIIAGNWFATIDLKDAYFQVLIWQGRWRFLRFWSNGQVFGDFPFGISVVPQTFLRCRMRPSLL